MVFFYVFVILIKLTINLRVFSSILQMLLANLIYLYFIFSF